MVALGDESRRDDEMSARCCRHFGFEKRTYFSYLPSPACRSSNLHTSQFMEQLRQRWLAAEHSAILLHPVNLFGINMNDDRNDLPALLFVWMNCTRQQATQRRIPSTCAPDRAVERHLAEQKCI